MSGDCNHGLPEPALGGWHLRLARAQPWVGISGPPEASRVDRSPFRPSTPRTGRRMCFSLGRRRASGERHVPCPSSASAEGLGRVRTGAYEQGVSKGKGPRTSRHSRGASVEPRHKGPRHRGPRHRRSRHEGPRHRGPRHGGPQQFMRYERGTNPEFRRYAPKMLHRQLVSLVTPTLNRFSIKSCLRNLLALRKLGAYVLV
jgi:hypothetical protein